MSQRISMTKEKDLHERFIATMSDQEREALSQKMSEKLDEIHEYRNGLVRQSIDRRRSEKVGAALDGKPEPNQERESPGATLPRGPQSS